MNQEEAKKINQEITELRNVIQKAQLTLRSKLSPVFDYLESEDDKSKRVEILDIVFANGEEDKVIEYFLRKKYT